MAEHYRCGCGEWTGQACEWTGPREEMVVVEYMPECLRESHRAARNSGVYPHNGAVRVACCRQCAEELLALDGEDEWSEIVQRSPAQYAEPVEAGVG